MPSTSATTRQDARAAGLRRRTLRIAAAGLTAAAALTLTACGGQDDGALKTGAAKPYHPAPKNIPGADPTGAQTAGTDTAGTDSGGSGQNTVRGGAKAGGDQGGGPRTDNAGTEQAATGKAGQDATRRTACDAAKIEITAKPLERPVNHLMLQATNTSGATCDLYAYPYLGFGEAQSPLAEFPDSKPQAVVTLAPGESGYASVLTSAADGSGGNGHRVSTLSVSLPGRDGNGSVGGAAQVALPGGSVYLDDSARVTYWQADPNDAAAW